MHKLSYGVKIDLHALCYKSVIYYHLLLHKRSQKLQSLGANWGFKGQKSRPKAENRGINFVSFTA